MANDPNNIIQSLTDTPDTTADFDKDDIEKNKVMAILAYLSWLLIIPLLVAKDSKFARYHVNQGLTLAICEIAWGVVFTILGIILSLLKLGFIAGILGILSVVFLVLAILGILNAVNGKAKELPVIGKFRLIK